MSSFTDLKELSKKPLVAFFFSIAILNISGLPPFPGFFAKFFLLNSLFSSGNHVYVIFLLFLSFISAFYYLKILMLIWIDYLKNSQLVEDRAFSYSFLPGNKLTQWLYCVVLLILISFFKIKILFNFFNNVALNCNVDIILLKFIF